MRFASGAAEGRRMPNGFHDDRSIDFFVLGHTSHGKPRFHTEKGMGGVAIVHMDHDRGYAYEPRWEAVELAPLGRRDEAVVQLVEARPELGYIACDTHVAAERRLPMHEPSACVVDLDPVEEWIASTAPLHEHALWDEIARAPLDAVESNGHVLCAVREHAEDVRRAVDASSYIHEGQEVHVCEQELGRP
jgi:hypothetical protein